MSFIIKAPTVKDLTDPLIQKALIAAHRDLSELKGTVSIIPNKEILLSNFMLQEAKDSSEIENIITTQDSMYRYQIGGDKGSHENEAVHNYVKALKYGLKQVEARGGISINIIKEIQEFIKPSHPGFRKSSDTKLKNERTGEVVYTPPSPDKIPGLMADLENFINQKNESMDSLIKMSVIHHWFESIHPFYDGNGRTGRILNILYLILEGLLDSPVLYLSRYINKNKEDYYHLLQKVRKEEDWKEWIIYMLSGVSVVSRQTITLIKDIEKLLKEYKSAIRDKHKFYSQTLINSLFSYPYTKVALIEKQMEVSRATATRYLDSLTESGILKKHKMGKESYYINWKLFDLLKDSYQKKS